MRPARRTEVFVVWVYGGCVFGNFLPLSRATIDRDALSRRDPELVMRLLGSSLTRVVIVDGARVAVRGSDDATRHALGEGQRYLARVSGENMPDIDAPFAYLGADHDFSYVGVDVGAWNEPDQLLTALADSEGEAFQWASLREVGTQLGGDETGLITTALALFQWHRRHRYCSRCGAATRSVESGWVRKCPVDGVEHFPRTDPAVIMAITDDDGRLLLGRGAHWPANRFSTLAGFVEPGETPENAVRREVFEEASIEVGDVEYQGSQPWPFPASLMLAYTGRALSTRIVVDGIEMLDARWFTREELSQAAGGGEIILPGPTSVARALIEQWYGSEVATPNASF